MRTISGAILLLTAEQAFSHSLSIGFPNAATAQDILYPASLVTSLLGVLLIAWGLVTERPGTRRTTGEQTAAEPTGPNDKA